MHTFVLSLAVVILFLIIGTLFWVVVADLFIRWSSDGRENLYDQFKRW